jgi:integrase
MAGKQAKILTGQQVAAALRRARQSRYAERDRVMILLSVKAGLRAGEIAMLTWSMVLNADGRIADRIELHDGAAKKRSGRTIPIHPDLRRALHRLRRRTGIEGALIRSERGGPRGMRPGSIVNWFGQLYRELGLTGCSSHSGRRTFITNAARLVFKAGGSLRDVQQLAGHRSIEQTQAYIDGSTRAKRRLIELL